jgi:radical SAM superfamily enzyme YgiQ (UPF0313 family)
VSLYYHEPVYRPPSEAHSLLIQATIGCSRSSCTYCISNTYRDFAIRPLEDIKKDLREARRLYGENAPRIFFLAQNAFAMPARDLITLSEYAYELFPGLKRISLYAHPLDILGKSPEELAAIRHSGISLLYIGLESGNDEVLGRVKKRLTAAQSVAGCRKAMDAGFELSCTVIIGLGGKEMLAAHAADTGRMISAISPHYLGCLTLMLVPGCEMAQSVKEGKFATLTSGEVLEELKLMLENIGPLERPCVFRANHASNYLPLAGDLPQDRERLIKKIDAALARPGSLKPEIFRAL